MLFVTTVLLDPWIETANGPATVRMLLSMRTEPGVLMIWISPMLPSTVIVLPVIVGSKVRINAFITLLGVIIGEAVWGIPGTFLAIPIIAIAKIIFDRIEPLKPWGYLFGDEVDEKEPPPLKEEIREQGHDVTNAPEKK